MRKHVKHFIEAAVTTGLLLSTVDAAWAQSHVTGVPELSSRPGAAYTVYLDFAGFNFTGDWGGTPGQTPGNIAAYLGVSNSGTFNSAQQNKIKQAWARIAEKYAPFNVNITTIDPAVAAGHASSDYQRQQYYDATPKLMHTVIGADDGSWIGSPGGVSYVGVTSDSYPTHPSYSNGFHTNWVFGPNLAGGDPKDIAEASAHENGHGLGLSHQSDFDGSTLKSEYTTNGGSSAIAPIMGVTYYSQRGVWTIGNSNNGGLTTQNDVAVILDNPGLTLVDDGIGHSTMTATTLSLSGNTVDYSLAQGVIIPVIGTSGNPYPIGTSSYTEDYFSFFSDGAEITLTAHAGGQWLTPGTAAPGATLDAMLSILDSTGNLLYTIDPGDSLDATFTGNLAPGGYFARVSSHGSNLHYGTQYNDDLYYDMGSFFLTGSGFATGGVTNDIVFYQSDAQVTLQHDETHAALYVVKGNVSFDLGGYIYTLTGDAQDRSVRIGYADGQAAQLNVTHGTLDGIQDILIGEVAGSHGLLKVYGQSTTVKAQTLQVGVAGSGAMVISDGAAVLSDSATLGHMTGSRGAVTVIGQGASWTVTHDLEVGSDGQGTLNISAGARVEADGATHIGSQGNIHLQTGGTLKTAALHFDGGLLNWAGGTLQGAAGAATPPVTLNAAGGTILVNAADHFTLDGPIDGSGRLTKTGAGTLTLTGVNTYTGGATLSGGTLRGNSISLPGDILNNAKLIFDQDADGTDAGAISGDGSLTKNGAGTLTLTGVNTYTGGTTVSSGALRGNAASLQGNITNNAKIIFDQGVDGRFTGTIRGGGSLTKTGVGTLTLSGVNTYTGGTIVLNGALQGDIHALPGNITDNAQVIFDQATDGTYTGIISGSGSVIKKGNGTLILDAPNTYTGGTTISSGALRINTSSLRGDIANNAQLIFDQAGDGTFAGIISGSGALTKTGPGTLKLSGVNTYAGLTTLQAGTLNLDSTGSLAGDVQVNAGRLIDNGMIGGTITLNDGLLQGAGVVRSLMARGGVVAPGNSIGTLQVQNNLTLGADAALAIEINSNGASDQIDLTHPGGAATLAHGSTILVAQVDDGDISDHQQWTIIRTDAGVTDNGAQLISGIAGYNFLGGGLGNNYVLTASAIPFADCVTDPAAQSGARALDQDYLSPHTSDALQNYIRQMRKWSAQQMTRQIKAAPRQTGQARLVGLRTQRAFTNTLTSYLSGQRHGLSGVMNNLSLGQLDESLSGVEFASAAPDPQILAAAFDTQYRGNPLPSGSSRQTDASRWGGFGTAYGVFDKRQTHDGQPGDTANTWAGQAGLDYRIADHWLLGLSFTYAHTEIDYAQSAGDGDIDSYRLGPYVGYDNGPWFAQASLTYAYGDNSVTRRAPAPGNQLNGDYASHNIAAYVGGGYDLWLDQPRQWLVTPEVGLEYSYTHTDGYKESGGAGAMAIDSQNFDSLRSKLGVTLTYSWELNSQVKLLPHVGAGWAHDYLSNDQDIGARFIGGASPFTVAVAGADRDSVFYGAGITALVGDRLSLGLNYHGETFSHEYTNAVVFSARVEF